MTRAAFPYLAVGGGPGFGAQARRFVTHAGAAGTEICIRLTVAGKPVHLSSRYLFVADIEFLKAEAQRVARAHDTIFPCHG